MSNLAAVHRGQALPNGAIVIDAKREVTELGPAVYILAMWCKGSRTEYVTWQVVDDEGNCEQGHYFCDILGAVNDFLERGQYRENN